MNSRNINEYSQAAREALFGSVVSDAAEYITRRMLYTNAGASNATYVGVALSLATNQATTITSGFTNPDFPRVLSIQGSITNLSGPITITGTDILGNTISSTVTVNNEDVVVGTRAFNTITSVSTPTQATTNGTFNIGITPRFGLDRLPDDNAVILGLVDGTRETTAPVITADAEISKSVVLFTTLPDGSKDFTLYYIGRDL